MRDRATAPAHPVQISLVRVPHAHKCCGTQRVVLGCGVWSRACACAESVTILLSSRAGSYAKHGPDYMSWSLLADAAVGAVVAAVAVAACPAAAPAACATAAAATVLTCRACGVRLGQLATKTYTVGAHYVQMHAGMAYMYIVHTCSRCNTAEVQLKKGACRRRAPPTPRTPRSLTL